MVMLVVKLWCMHDHCMVQYWPHLLCVLVAVEHHDADTVDGMCVCCVL